MRRSMVVLLVLLFIGALVAFIPAILLTDRIQARAPEVRFEGVSGSIWNGRVVALRIGSRDLGALRWQIRPSGFTKGRLEVDAELFGQPGSLVQRFTGRLWAGFSGRRGADTIAARFSGETLVPIFQNTGLVPGGMIDLAVETVEFQGSVPKRLTGEALWRDAVVSGAERAALGDLAMSFALVDGQVIGSLRDAGGPLALTGSFEVTAAGYRMDAHLQARDPSLNAALRHIGQPDGGGRLLVLQGGWLSGWLEAD